MYTSKNSHGDIVFSIEMSVIVFKINMYPTGSSNEQKYYQMLMSHGTWWFNGCHLSFARRGSKFVWLLRFVYLCQMAYIIHTRKLDWMMLASYGYFIQTSSAYYVLAI